MNWREILEEEQKKDYYVRLKRTVEEAYAEGRVFPPHEMIYRALSLTPFEDVRVVILGQDPYHGAGQAHGLSFSVQHGVRIPPSLQNIYKELEMETGLTPAHHGCLQHWALQGVLMLNTVLTVEEGRAASHRGIGWEILTDHLIRTLSNREKPVIFVLWGNDAKRKRELIDEHRHTVLTAAHPSPFAAHKGFFGCNVFNRVNDILVGRGETPINWSVYRAAVFDLDGTLTQTLPSIHKTVSLTMAHYTDHEYTPEEVRSMIGDGAEILVRRSLRLVGIEDEETVKEAIRTYFHYFKTWATFGVHPFDGIPEVLKAYRKAGFRLGVYSNKPHTQTVEIVEQQFPGMFDFVIGKTSDEERKPKVNVLIEELKKLAIDPRDVIYIGDSETDMETGRNGRMKTIGVTWGFRSGEQLKPYRPHRLIDDPRELLREIGYKEELW